MPPEVATPPSSARLVATLDTVASRLSTQQTLAGAGSGCGGAALVAFALIRSGQPRYVAAVASCIVVAAAILMVRWSGRNARTRASAARAIEHHAPECHNIVITGEELLRMPRRTPSWIQTRVFDDAVELTNGLRPAHVVSLGRVASVCMVSIGLLVSILARLDRPPAQMMRQIAERVPSGSGDVEAGPLSIVAIVQPPAYIGASPRSIENPEHIEALQGSRVRLRLRGPAARVRYGARPVAVTVSGSHREAEVVLADSGYFAVESANATSGTRLIAVTVTPDHAPSIRIEAPGRDLLLPDTSATVPVTAVASDDFGLRDLEIRYTRVSGSGEQFEFVEGALPLSLARESGRAWKAKASLRLSGLKLAPGDSLVYRAVARDARPGDAGLASSDTFFVEIAGPGHVALSGFEMPPDRERHALSQQMIVLKIERLRARERTLTREALQEHAAAIAAEQRAVRANFIFLMGGHVEDEEEEAEHSHEIQEGRLKNDARSQISAAIGHMTRAEQALTALQTGAALPPAKAAVEALQRAFGRNRYLLRTLPVRSRIDPARRLSGELMAARDWRRELQPATIDVEIREERALLVRLLDLAPAFTGTTQMVPRAETFVALAESALAVGASDPAWQQIARDLQQLGDQLARGRPMRDVAPDFNKIAVATFARVQQRAVAAPLEPPAGAMRAAWAEGTRR